MIRQRLLEYLTSKGITRYQFYKDTGLSNGFLDKEGSIGSDNCEKISYQYPDLNLIWLITGKGHSLIPSASIGVVEEPATDYGIKKINRLKADRKKEVQRIPLYDIKATAGIVDLLRDTNRERYIPIDYIIIPNMPKCDGALPITGDSMYPILKSGDIVLYKEVHDKRNIIWGEMYLAAIKSDGDEFFFSKYIQKSEREGYARFVSENRHHQPVEFPIDDIIAVALIKASIRYNSAF